MYPTYEMLAGVPRKRRLYDGPKWQPFQLPWQATAKPLAEQKPEDWPAEEKPKISLTSPSECE